MSEPSVSIVIPVSRDKDGLAECLASVSQQDYPHKEVLVVCEADAGDPAAWPGFSEGMRAIREKEARTQSELADAGLRAARGQVKILLMPCCTPLGTAWIRSMTSPFEDDSVGVVVSQCIPAPGEPRGLIPRLVDSISQPERHNPGSALLRQDAAGLLCDAYRASLLADMGYLGSDGLAPAAQPLNLSVKVAGAGYSIMLSDTAAVAYRVPGSQRHIKGAVLKAWEYGLADAQLDRLHGLRWLNAGVLAAAFFSLFLLPLGAYNLSFAVIIGALIFAWSAFLSLRLPVLGWEWPLFVGNALGFVAIALFVRRDWWPSFFGKQVHPAIIRQWCWLAAITGSDLLVLGKASLAGAMRTVRSPLDLLYVLPVFTLGLPWRLLIGVGYFFGPLAQPSRKEKRQSE